MPQLSIDLTELPLALRRSIDEKCRDAKRKALAAAKIRQATAMKFLRDHPPRAVEGLGGQTLFMDPVLWSLLRHGTRAAPGEDQETQDWLARRDPDFYRVRHTATKLQVGHWSTPEFRPAVKGLEAVERPGVREVKRY